MPMGKAGFCVVQIKEAQVLLTRMYNPYQKPISTLDCNFEIVAKVVV